MQVELKTGLLTKWDSRKPSSDRQKKKLLLYPETVDFETITADIISVTSKLVYTEYLCEFRTPKLVSFDRINCRMLEAVSPSDRKENLVNIEKGFPDETALMQNTIEGVQLGKG